MQHRISLNTAGKLVDALGSADFERVLWESLSEAFQTEHVSMGRFALIGETAAPPVEFIGAYGCQGREVIQAAWTQYSSHYWHVDPLRQYMRPDLSDLVVHQQVLRNIPKDFYQACYGQNISEEGVLLSRNGNSVYTLSIFRSVSQPAFSSGDLVSLRSLSSLLTPLLAKHVMFRPPAVLASPADKWQQQFERGLFNTGISLSLREKYICQGLLAGHTQPQLASQLDLKLSTVNTYVDRSFCKLGIRTRRDLLDWCIRHSN